MWEGARESTNVLDCRNMGNPGCEQHSSDMPGFGWDDLLYVMAPTAGGLVCVALLLAYQRRQQLKRLAAYAALQSSQK